MFGKKEHYDFMERKFCELQGPKDDAYDRRTETVKEWVGKGKRVLSLGPHSGFITNKITEGNEVIGIELPSVMHKFKEKYKFPCMRGNAEDLSMFDDEYFDVVFCGELLIHLHSPSQCMLEISRVLKNGGFVITSTPRGWYGGEIFSYVFDEVTLKLFHELYGFNVIKGAVSHEEHGLAMVIAQKPAIKEEQKE